MEGKCLGVFGLSLYTTAEELETVSKKIQSKFKRFFSFLNLGHQNNWILYLESIQSVIHFYVFRLNYILYIYHIFDKHKKTL